MESNALQRNSLQKNRQKSGIDCNVTAFVSGLRSTLSKTAVQRNPLQKFKIPTFGTVRTGPEAVLNLGQNLIAYCIINSPLDLNTVHHLIHLSRDPQIELT